MALHLGTPSGNAPPPLSLVLLRPQTGNSSRVNTPSLLRSSISNNRFSLGSISSSFGGAWATPDGLIGSPEGLIIGTPEGLILTGGKTAGWPSGTFGVGTRYDTEEPGVGTWSATEEPGVGVRSATEEPWKAFGIPGPFGMGTRSDTEEPGVVIVETGDLIVCGTIARSEEFSEFADVVGLVTPGLRNGLKLSGCGAS